MPPPVVSNSQQSQYSSGSGGDTAQQWAQYQQQYQQYYQQYQQVLINFNFYKINQINYFSTISSRCKSKEREKRSLSFEIEEDHHPPPPAILDIHTTTLSRINTHTNIK